MQAAEKLKDELWGRTLDRFSEEISIDGDTWQHVPHKHIVSLEMSQIGYDASGVGLLIRKEYENACKLPMFQGENALKSGCGGIVVTGQPGIGMFSLTNY